MARKSFEKQVFDVAQSDIRVRVMDMAMRGFFFTLVALFRSLATDGRVVFGCGRVPCLADVVADSFCGMSVTEFKTHLETQCKTHLFAWDEAAQTLIYEPDEGLSARTKANRENGRKGGRPRKNTITERNDPAQRYITMSIQGGRDVSKHGTQSETHASIAKLASTDNNQVKAKLRDPSKEEIDAVYQRIGPVAFDAAGFDPARDALNWLAARQWAADGLAKGMTADEIERVVVAEVSRIAERQRSKGKPAPHLGYFGKAVAQAIATGTIPPVQQTPAQREADQAYVEAMQAWQRGGMKGPRPELADYRAKVAA